MDRKTLTAWERHGQERDRVIKLALKADVLSQVRTAHNYYEDVNYLGNFAGDVLFQHRITNQFINMPLEGHGLWNNQRSDLMSITQTSTTQIAQKRPLGYFKLISQAGLLLMFWK